jgi:uncharacterized protein (TIGR02466 family)
VEVPIATRVHRPINTAILNRLDEMRRGLPPLARGEAWQSGHGLHKQEELRGLVSCIDAGVVPLAFLCVVPQVLITGCWANVSAPGAAHRMHAHPNNFLSGVYYVQVQSGADTINFHDPRRRRRSSGQRSPSSPLTTPIRWCSRSARTLIVFPAWLPHSVDANQSELMRISISFNVMFVAFAQTMGQPLWGEQ